MCLILSFLLMALISGSSSKKKINQNKTKKTPKTKQSTKQSEQCPVKLLLSHIVSKPPQNQTN